MKLEESGLWDCSHLARPLGRTRFPSQPQLAPQHKPQTAVCLIESSQYDAHFVHAEDHVSREQCERRGFYTHDHRAMLQKVTSACESRLIHVLHSIISSLINPPYLESHPPLILDPFPLPPLRRSEQLSPYLQSHHRHRVQLHSLRRRRPLLVLPSLLPTLR